MLLHSNSSNLHESDRITKFGELNTRDNCSKPAKFSKRNTRRKATDCCNIRSNLPSQSSNFFDRIVKIKFPRTECRNIDTKLASLNSGLHLGNILRRGGGGDISKDRRRGGGGGTGER